MPDARTEAVRIASAATAAETKDGSRSAIVHAVLDELGNANMRVLPPRPGPDLADDRDHLTRRDIRAIADEFLDGAA